LLHQDAVSPPQPKFHNLVPQIHFVRYANDFIITGVRKKLLEYEVKLLVIKFLVTRGLELSEKKTKMAQINNGFDFPGFNIRKYKGKGSNSKKLRGT
jgi:RNA-directed DNA polymerase